MRSPHPTLILFLAVLGFAATVRAAGPAARSGRDPTVVARLIDEHIGGKLTEAKVSPADRTTDAVFLRRASLDIAGIIPTAAQARAFLESTDPDKRHKLIDDLLAEPAYGQHFARLWRDRLAHEEGAGGARRLVLETWLADRFNQNVGWERTVTELIVAEGTTPATAFVHDHLDDGQPRLNKLTAATARLFLGTQLQCAECHDHPYADWKQSDFWGLAALFSRTLLVKGEKKLHDRGLLEETLVVVMGEFGRTPRCATDGSRNHYVKAWSTMLFGGGIKAGQVVGRTDKLGATVEDRRVSGPQFMPTVLHLLGINPAGRLTAPGDRPVHIVDQQAQPVKEVTG